MLQPLLHPISIPTPEAMTNLAQRLAATLHPGDVLLLDGPIGAGKTHFARSLIQDLQGPAHKEDVPSPTFTLVQTYDTPSGEVWHADLYRLTDLSEVLELGLEDAFQTAICLIEWPDRLADSAPTNALWLSIKPQPDDSRQITFSGRDPWGTRLAAVFDTGTP